MFREVSQRHKGIIAIKHLVAVRQLPNPFIRGFLHDQGFQDMATRIEHNSYGLFERWKTQSLLLLIHPKRALLTAAVSIQAFNVDGCLEQSHNGVQLLDLFYIDDHFMLRYQNVHICFT